MSGMGRLFKPVSNGRARLMIEVALGAIQNPAYSFAAELYNPFLQTGRGYFFNKNQILKLKN
jgi:hypothetical protein